MRESAAHNGRDGAKTSPVVEPFVSRRTTDARGNRTLRGVRRASRARYRRADFRRNPVLRPHRNPGLGVLAGRRIIAP